MQCNVVVLGGRLAAPVEIRTFEGGSRLVRCLLTVRSEAPRHRIDVVPVTLWDPPDDLLSRPPAPGDALLAVGAVQRRFWSAADGRRSRIEVVAGHLARSGRAPGPEYPLADATGRDLR